MPFKRFLRKTLLPFFPEINSFKHKRLAQFLLALCLLFAVDGYLSILIGILILLRIQIPQWLYYLLAPSLFGYGYVLLPILPNVNLENNSQTFFILILIFIFGLIFLPSLVIKYVLQTINHQGKQVSKWKIGFFIVTCLSLAMTYLYLTKPAKLTSDNSYTFPISKGNNSFSCTGVVTTSANMNHNYSNKQDTIIADSSMDQKLLDIFALSIDGNNLHMLSQGMLQTGQTQDDNPMHILSNTDKQLIAVGQDNSVINNPVDVFMLDKEKGAGVWGEFGMLLNLFAPGGQLEYLKCH